MKAFSSDHYVVPLPAGHRFPMPKYALLRQRVLAEGVLAEEDILISPPATDSELLLAHEPGYVEKVVHGLLSDKETRRIGFPWSPELVERSRRSTGGTIAACRVALREGIAANLAGGTHHAYPDHGEGYCVFNDVAVASRTMQAEGRVRRVVIIDLDVHQGNGTAAIFAGDSTVFTFSVHGAKNFPFHKESSNLDIALPDGSDDTDFLEAVQWGTQLAIERAQADLAIYIAGADPFKGDRLGRLEVTKEGLKTRDKLVFDLIGSAHLPVAVVMGGGYAKQFEDTVDIHVQTLTIAASYARSLSGR